MTLAFCDDHRCDVVQLFMPSSLQLLLLLLLSLAYLYSPAEPVLLCLVTALIFV